MTATNPGRDVNSLLAFLREETRRDHHELDHHPVLQQLMDPALDRDGYAAALHALYRPQRFMETSVEAGYRKLGLDSQPCSSSRTDALRRDLMALGHSVPEIRDEEVLLARSTGFLMGQQYVLEGARKGSVIVARQLRKTLGTEVPMAYFGASEPEAHWRPFIAQLTVLLPSIDREAALHGARSMFHAYYSRLP
ncbi:MAG: biliverdin-producing heme oxygenase [Pseudomonadota bacterium]